jgi:hypothetical protein
MLARLVACTVALLLTACVPPALQFVSYAIDGLSLVSTNKSVSSHVLSTVVNDDCEFFRIAKGQKLCGATANDTFVASIRRLLDDEPIVLTGFAASVVDAD